MISEEVRFDQITALTLRIRTDGPEQTVRTPSESAPEVTHFLEFFFILAFSRHISVVLAIFSMASELNEFLSTKHILV